MTLLLDATTDFEPLQAGPVSGLATPYLELERVPRVLEVGELAEHLSYDNVLLVDVRSPEQCVDGHIPGAVMLAYADLIRHEGPVSGAVPTVDQLSSVLSAVGLDRGIHVVAYDDDKGSHASRLLWTLDFVGHQNHSLLNGGFAAWDDDALPIDEHPATPSTTSYNAMPESAVIADYDYIRANLTNPDVVLLDTRTPAEFDGIDVRAKRGGHIPNAINFDWSLAIDLLENGRVRDGEDLSKQLGRLGVTPDREIVVYCHTHHRSSHTYLVLKHLGFPRVRAYPGSWSEWGNRDGAPVQR